MPPRKRASAARKRPSAAQKDTAKATKRLRGEKGNYSQVQQEEQQQQQEHPHGAQRQQQQQQEQDAQLPSLAFSSSHFGSYTASDSGSDIDSDGASDIDSDSESEGEGMSSSSQEEQMSLLERLQQTSAFDADQASASSALQGGRLRALVDGLNTPDLTVMLTCVMEMADFLAICTEESLQSACGSSGVTPDNIVTALLPMVANADMSPDAALFALRSLSHLIEAMPNSAGHVIAADGAKILVERLRDPQYMDLIEQAISCMEKLSQENAAGPALAQSGALWAVLQFSAFFAVHTQKSALTVALNASRFVYPHNFSECVDSDAIPALVEMVTRHRDEDTDSQMFATYSANVLTRLVEAACGEPGAAARVVFSSSSRIVGIMCDVLRASTSASESGAPSRSHALPGGQLSLVSCALRTLAFAARTATSGTAALESEDATVARDSFLQRLFDEEDIATVLRQMLRPSPVPGSLSASGSIANGLPSTVVEPLTSDRAADLLLFADALLPAFPQSAQQDLWFLDFNPFAVANSHFGGLGHLYAGNALGQSTGYGIFPARRGSGSSIRHMEILRAMRGFQAQGAPVPRHLVRLATEGGSAEPALANAGVPFKVRSFGGVPAVHLPFNLLQHVTKQSRLQLHKMGAQAPSEAAAFSAADTVPSSKIGSFQQGHVDSLVSALVSPLLGLFSTDTSASVLQNALGVLMKLFLHASEEALRVDLRDLSVSAFLAGLVRKGLVARVDQLDSAVSEPQEHPTAAADRSATYAMFGDFVGKDVSDLAKADGELTRALRVNTESAGLSRRKAMGTQQVCQEFSSCAAALFMCETLMKKLPTIFSRAFLREGCAHVISTLALRFGAFAPLADFYRVRVGSETNSDGVNALEFFEAHADKHFPLSPPSDGETSEQSFANIDFNTLSRLKLAACSTFVGANAGALHRAYFDPESGSAPAHDELTRLSLCAKSLCDSISADSDQQVTALRLLRVCLADRGSISTFELLQSNLLPAIYLFLLGETNDTLDARVLIKIEHRTSLFVEEVLLGEDAFCDDSTRLASARRVLRLLQRCLAQAEKFPIVAAGNGSTSTSGNFSTLRSLSNALKFKLIPLSSDGLPDEKNSTQVMVEPLASVDTVMRFVQERTSGGGSFETARISAGSNALGGPSEGESDEDEDDVYGHEDPRQVSVMQDEEKTSLLQSVSRPQENVTLYLGEPLSGGGEPFRSFQFGDDGSSQPSASSLHSRAGGRRTQLFPTGAGFFGSPLARHSTIFSSLQRALVDRHCQTQELGDIPDQPSSLWEGMTAIYYSVSDSGPDTNMDPDAAASILRPPTSSAYAAFLVRDLSEFRKDLHGSHDVQLATSARTMIPSSDPVGEREERHTALMCIELLFALHALVGEPSLIHDLLRRYSLKSSGALTFLASMSPDVDAMSAGESAFALPRAIIPSSDRAWKSSKLSQKALRQLQDPLMAAAGSGGFPGWLPALFESAPFLFPLGLRRLYTVCSNFGLLRSIQALLLEGQRAADTSNAASDTVAVRMNTPLVRTNFAAHSGGSASQAPHMQAFTRLPRQRVRISRATNVSAPASFVKSAMRALELFGDAKTVLEVQYFDEVGTGLGPTLEFYTSVAESFRCRKLGMWRGDEDVEADPSTGGLSTHSGRPGSLNAPLPPSSVWGYFPRAYAPSSAIPASVLKNFKFFGVLCAKAMLDGRLLDITMSPIFWKLALEYRRYGSLSREDRAHDLFSDIQDLTKIDPDLSYQLKKIACVATANGIGGSEQIEDWSIDFALPGIDPAVWSIVPKSGPAEFVNNQNAIEFVGLVCDSILCKGINRQLAAFCDGFDRVFALERLSVLSPMEISEIVSGESAESQTWVPEGLAAHVKCDHGYTPTTLVVRWLLEVVCEFDPETRRMFILFVTGSPQLPPGGFAALEPKFTVVPRSGTSSSAMNLSFDSSFGEGSAAAAAAATAAASDIDASLPSVNTCFYYLKLPEYSSKEVLRDRLTLAVRHGQGYFSFN